MLRSKFRPRNGSELRVVAWTLFQTLQLCSHSYQAIQLFCLIDAKNYYPINRVLSNRALLHCCLLTSVKNKRLSAFPACIWSWSSLFLIKEFTLMMNMPPPSSLLIGLCVKVTCVTKQILSTKLKMAIETRIVRVNQQFVTWATAFLSSVQRVVVLLSHQFWHKAPWFLS